MKIVYIKWADAAETEKYHKDIGSLKGQGLGLDTNSSVGIVVESTKEYISIAQSLAENGWFMDIINIPKALIISEEVLKEGE